MLTDKGTVARPWEAFFKPQQLPAGVEEKFQFVHPDLTADETSSKVLDLIGVVELPGSMIKEAVAESVIPEVRQTWPYLPEAARLSWLVSFKHMVESGEISSRDLEFVTIPTRSGRWAPRGEVLFAAEYSPDLSIETLVKRGLLHDPSIEFVTSDLANSGGGSLESWKRFLSDLGVGLPASTQSRQNQWASYVGVQMARRYEKKHGRTEIHEVSEAERGVKDPGYDLHSRTAAGSDERYIEAKATRGQGDFTLRPTTLREMFVGPNKDRFYIYVTAQALTSPRLHVIKAGEMNEEVLLRVGEIRLDVQHVPVTETVDFEVLCNRPKDSGEKVP